MRRTVVAWPNWTTSIGSGARPSMATRLAASAMTTTLREASQTSFSRSSAPPPPLISASPGPISSAPSTVRSIVPAWSSSTRVRPSERAKPAVPSEVGTQVRRVSPAAVSRRARASTK
jgi:hypothetical protein